MLKSAPLLLLLSFFCLAILLGCPDKTPALPAVDANLSATAPVSDSPKVVLVSIDELEKRFASTGDTLTLYNFWATWCKPCIEEMPYFLALQKQYPAGKVKVVFVSMDSPKSVESKLLPFLKSRELTGEFLLLTGKANDYINRVSPEWSGAIPATLFAQPTHKVYAFLEREFNQTELNEKVESFLRNTNH